MTNGIGIYIHIPFCKGKCNYCDFYSTLPCASTKTRYIDRICNELKKWGGHTARPIDSIYIGGGTPSLLEKEELSAIMTAIRTYFKVADNAEITAEVNPGDNTTEFLAFAKELGLNRISIGVQSANDDELKLLGRRHTFADAKDTVNAARRLGFTNISADIMIGLPNSSAETLQSSINQILALNTEHLSAYILKIEKGTPFASANLNLPDDDGIADQYLQMCTCFEKAGFEHYEISNFAKPGFQSRHNNLYWLDKEYIGIGPAAHSFFEGERFYYPRDIESFIENADIIKDGVGGGREEFVMLALRLSRGLVFKEYEDRFGEKISQKLINKARLFEKKRLCILEQNSISLTDEGMLVSNAIISELIGELYENI